MLLIQNKINYCFVHCKSFTTVQRYLQESMNIYRCFDKENVAYWHWFMQFCACIIDFNCISDGSNSSCHKEMKSDLCFPTLKRNYFEICLFMQVKKRMNFKLQDFGPTTTTYKTFNSLAGQMQNLDAQVYVEKPNLAICTPKTCRRKKNNQL